MNENSDLAIRKSFRKIMSYDPLGFTLSEHVIDVTNEGTLLRRM